jgi:hypothetical protein
MNEALETLYALRIIYWCRGDKKIYKRIARDIKALEVDAT